MMNIDLGKTVVMKFGGSAMSDPVTMQEFAKSILPLIARGTRCVIVHGGGPEIDRWLNKVDIEKEFYNGLRVTNAEAMEIVEMVLSGKINKGLASTLCHSGVPAVGISGRDGNLLLAEKISDKLGQVGRVTYVNSELLDRLLPDYVPIISTVASESTGQPLNINADFGAAAIAGSIKADRLILLTDTNGVRQDPKDPNSVIPRLNELEAKLLIDSGIAERGMIPKLESAIQAVNDNVQSVWIIKPETWCDIIGNIDSVDNVFEKHSHTVITHS